MAVNAYLTPWLRAGFTDNSGNPLYQGLLYSYQAGSSTPAATYTDSTATTPNTNPITLNSRGEAPNGIWLLPGQGYKFTLTDSGGNQIWTVDQVYAQISVQTGTFTATGIGFSGTPPAFACSYTVIQDVATVIIGPNTGASNANFFQLSGIPSILRPSTTTPMVSIPFALDAGALTGSTGIVILPQQNYWQVFKANSNSAWTASGSKGFPSPYSVSLSYQLV